MTTAVLGWVGDGPYGDPSRAPFWPFLPICIGVGSRRVLPRPGAAAPSQTLPDLHEIGGLIEAPGKKSGGLCCRFRMKRDQNAQAVGLRCDRYYGIWLIIYGAPYGSL